ncbi:MAG: hypothetical protein J6X44_10135 [Thermoguttaceae bacterium]|nr:hypothetical protein [Thermoguttaceae bacterium]
MPILFYLVERQYDGLSTRILWRLLKKSQEPHKNGAVPDGREPGDAPT